MKCIVFTGWKHQLNVLSIIRTADGLGFDEVLITGRKKFKHSKFCKHSLRGWTGYKPQVKFFEDINLLIEYLKKENYALVSMEIDNNAKKLQDYTWPMNPAIVVGHEREGVDKEILSISDKIMLPMQGQVRCMNVGCAASIAMYDHITKTEE